MICGYSGSRPDDYSGISRTPVGNFRYRSGETKFRPQADNDHYTQLRKPGIGWHPRSSNSLRILAVTMHRHRSDSWRVIELK
ncbi:hypothetical protein BDW66DRAFT_93887 [Aspergillus desertorum]